MADYDMPPPKRAGNAEPPTPMSNSDFRKMLETPRPRHAPTPSRHAQRSNATFNTPSSKVSNNDSKARKPPKATKPNPNKEKEEEKKDGPIYRDRAAERREGKLGEYEHIAEELPTILQTRGLAADPSNISIEQSKYLGGDVEHTHLVKGLDYALLQKERTRVEKETERVEKEAVKKEARIRKEDLTIHSSLARGVVEALFHPPRRDLKDLFLPRRTAFCYDLQPEDPWASSDIPTTLHRSKGDCPPPVDSQMGLADRDVLRRLTSLLGHVSFSGGAKGGKKLKRREREALLFGGEAKAAAGAAAVEGAVLKGSMAPPPAKGAAGGARKGPVDEDDDIFGDAGTEYKPAIPADRAGGVLARKKDTYFEKKDDMSDIPMPASAKPKRGGAHSSDMEDGEVPPPPPPPPLPPAHGADYGPQRPDPHQQHSYDQYGGYPYPPPPPEGVQYDSYGNPQQQQHYPPPPPQMPPAGPGGYVDPQAYEAYVQANIAYQASMDPEYQALLAKQQGLREEEGEGAAARAGQPAGGSAAQLTQEEKDAGMATVFKGDGERWVVKGAKKVAADEEVLDDAYAECYPSYHHLGAEVVDSDNEDLDQMDGKGRGMARQDFQTEEEWQQYKSLREANPKAAYQFGIKASDGRQKPKNLEKAKETKLSSQLHKIEGLMKEKGTYSEAAFRAKPEEPFEAPTPMRAKRMRI